MDIGIIDYLLCEEESECFAAAAAIGLANVDWTLDREDDAAKLLADDERLGRILERMRATGVRIRALYATCFQRISLTDDDGSLRTQAVDRLREIAVLAGNLGVAAIVVPLFGASEIATVDDVPKLKRLATAVASIAAAQRTRIAFKSILPTEIVVAALAEVRCEQLGICFDPANCLALGRDPVGELRLASSALFHVHLKDRDRLGDRKDLGEGEVNLAELAAQLRSMDYSGPLVLETPSGEAPRESAARNLQSLRAALQL